ncbi:MAG: hypothetical protein AB7W37_05965 [Syntrophobacteraceae bacterium]
MIRSIYERRCVRMRRSALPEETLDGTDEPSVEWADDPEEIKKARSLVYREYLKMGYVRDSEMVSSIADDRHPNADSLVVKFGAEIIATLSMVMDSDLFGLPMDTLYRNELNALRAQGLRIVELSSLAASERHPAGKFLMPLFRAVYWRAALKSVDNLCIMVNPRHVLFYKTVFLFEDLGPERFYPKVQAPAVALTACVHGYRERLYNAYRGADSTADLHRYFFNPMKNAMGALLGMPPQLQVRI